MEIIKARLSYRPHGEKGEVRLWKGSVFPVEKRFSFMDSNLSATKIFFALSVGLKEKYPNPLNTT